MRYYIVDKNGNVLGESESYEKCEIEIALLYNEEEIKEQEIEIIEGS